MSFSPRRRQGAPATYQASRRPSPRPELEALEDRSLLSASPSAAALPASYGQLPLAFEVNQGQAAPGVDYEAHGSGYTLDLSPQQAALNLSGQGTTPTTLTMQLAGANPSAQAVGSDQLITRSNYLAGPDPSKWITNIANYGKVTYQDVYAGTDVAYYGNQGRLEYDFTLHPGADPRAIRLLFQGQQGMSLDGQGNLVVQTAAGPLVEQAPVAYQPNADGSQTGVSSRYVLEGNGQVGFAVGAYDPTKALVIDPVLSYSSYLTGQGDGIAVDSSGNAYVTGWGSSGPYVDKLNASGTALVYSTTLGGGGQGLAIAVDGAGDAYVFGDTGPGLATTANAIAPTDTSPFNEEFVTVLDATGSGLIDSTYLPGTSPVNAYFLGGIAVDGSGNACVTGWAGPGFLTTANAYQPGYAGSPGSSPSGNAFFAQINPSLSGTASLLYSSYLGGNGGDMGTGIALDGSGNAYVTGWTSSANFPTTAGAFQTAYGGKGDDFVAKFNPSLSGPSSLVYSTYLGGSGIEGFLSDNPSYIVAYNTGPGIAVDSSGDAYVAGGTTSTNFPTTPGALQTRYNGPRNPNASGDGFVTKLNAAGTGLVYSTYLGGSSYDGAGAVAVDSSGDAHVTGWTQSTDFPTKNPIQASKSKGKDPNNGLPNSDAFVATLNGIGSGLVFSTYLGGTNNDYGFGIALDAAGNTYVTGQTLSSNFPTTAGAPLTSGSGFVAKIGTSGNGAVSQSAVPAVAPAGSSAVGPVAVSVTSPFASAPVQIGLPAAGVPSGTGALAGLGVPPALPANVPAATAAPADGSPPPPALSAFSPLVLGPVGATTSLDAWRTAALDAAFAGSADGSLRPFDLLPGE
jgi:hypothetical protein